MNKIVKIFIQLTIYSALSVILAALIIFIVIVFFYFISKL